MLDLGTLNNAAEGVGRARAESGVDASLEDNRLACFDCTEEIRFSTLKQAVSLKPSVHCHTDITLLHEYSDIEQSTETHRY